MKQITLLLVLILGINGYVCAQKIGYVDTDYILNKIPDYQQTQQELETVSVKWQEEIGTMKKQVEAMYNDLQAEEVLLTEDMIQEKMAGITAKEDSLKIYQQKVFGFEGLFFLKKKELIKPIQDKVFDAIEKVARKHRLQIVFDKSGELVMIYTDPRHDYTDFVLEELGLGDPRDNIK